MKAQMDSRVWQLVGKAFLALSCLIVLVPVVWIIVTSFKSNKEINAGALGLPQQLNFENYTQAWIEGGFGRYFLNSAIVGISTAIIVVLAASLAGYVFARINFRGRSLLFALFIAGMTLPVTTRLVPLLSMMYSFGLVNKTLGLVLVYSASSIPFGILMMRSFFLGFPFELEDAGFIDGCNRWQFVTRILLPLSLPAIFVLGIFVFMDAWNEFYMALVLISKNDARTLPLGLLAFQGQHYTNYALSIAGINITAVPVIIIYVLFQRNLIRGIVAGSLK